MSTSSSERRVAINTASKYATVAVRFVTYMLLTPFLLSTIGTRLLGLHALANQALQFLNLARNAIGLSYNRFATVHYARGEYDKMNSALSVGFVLCLLSGVLFALGTVLVAVFARVLFGLPEEIIPVARVVILITGCTSAVSFVTGVWKSPMFIKQRFDIDSLGHIVATVGAAVGVWIAFQFMAPSIIIWVVITCAFRLGKELFLVIPLCIRTLPQIRIRLNLITSGKQIREMVNFGGLSFVGGLGYLLYYSTDSIIISNLDVLGVESVFFYNIAQRWDPQVRIIIAGFVATLTPMMTSHAAVEDLPRLRNTLVRGVRYSLILGALPCVLLVLYADPFLTLWLGAEAAERSAPVMRIIMACMLFSIPSIVDQQALFAVGRIGLEVVFTIIGGIVNIVLSIICASVLGWGLVGIAAGSMIAIALVQWIAIPVLTLRYTNLPTRVYLLQGCLRPLLSLVPLAGFALLLQRVWIPGGILALLAQFALCSLVYLAAVALVAFTPEDRKRVRTLLSDARSRLGRPAR